MAKRGFKSNKQYWAAIKNFRRHLNESSREGRALRNKVYNITKNSAFKESNFRKNEEKGKIFVIKEARTAFKLIKIREKQELRMIWKEERNEPTMQFTNFDDFYNVNRSPDYYEIRESFNSPK